MIQLKILNYSIDDSRFGTVAPYWVNLVNDCRDKCTGDDYDKKVWTHIYAELAMYNATFKDFMIEFEDESQATMFILRWT